MADKRIAYQYKDKGSGRIINSNKVVADDENGIIEYTGDASFRFIPKSRLHKEPVAADYGYDEATMPSVPDKPDTVSYNGTTPGSRQKPLGAFYDYTFGIDGIEIRETSPKKTCGFISQDIHVGSCDYLELSVDVSNPGMTIEYSIMDGLQEKPIFPVDETEIQHERLFYGLGTRFPIDLTKPITIYKNGEKTALRYTEIDKIPYGSDLYTICYTPTITSHRVIPKNKNVRVKVVQRYDSGLTLPATINSIVIKKFGGDKLWSV